MAHLYQIDPLKDERWKLLVEEHPEASVFHTPGWLQALKRTYGYEPIAFTTSKPGTKCTNGIAFCRVTSWVTGSRLVSVPFSDHCQPLVDCTESLTTLLSGLQHEAKLGGWKYIELRPVPSESMVFEDTVPYSDGERFYFHRLDLRPDPESLFRGFHKSCIQRKIRKAERENLSYESGRSEELLQKFYNLLVLTRRRHQLPPQPVIWFQQLIECLGDRLTIHLVSKDGVPAASILTLGHRGSLVYKYGCSDERFHNLGGMPLLFWTVIQEAKKSGFWELDLGRSEVDNSGLVQFKGHLGANCSELTYWRYPAPSEANPIVSWGGRAARYMFSRVPDSWLVPAGKLLYRHLG